MRGVRPQAVKKLMELVGTTLVQQACRGNAGHRPICDHDLASLRPVPFSPPRPRPPVPVYARTFTQTHQAGLSVMNLQNGVLPHGWLEYMDESSGRPYYFNVHNQASAGLRRIAFARRPEGG